MQQRHARVAMAAIAVAAAATMWLPARAQAPAQIGPSPLLHVGVVVSNIEETARQYVRVMGFAPPAVMSGIAVDAPGGQKVTEKLTTVYMPNFYIELIQPVSQNGPYAEHWQKYGMSIQHMGLAVDGDIDVVRAGLEQKGGRWTLGAKGGGWAYTDFHQTLGTTFETIKPSMVRSGAAPSAAPGAALPPLGSLPVTHVGFAVTDADKVAKGFADVFGIPAPQVREYKDSQYPPDSRWSKDAFLRLTFWQQGKLGIELIQSVGGPTPWTEYVQAQKGTAAQHIAINVGDRMDETIRDLQMKGGKWTNGKPGGSYAYLDFMDTLGLIFELNGTSKSAAAVK